MKNSVLNDISNNFSRTENGDLCYGSTGSLMIDFFARAGSIFTTKETGGSEALNLFKEIWVACDDNQVAKVNAVALLFWLRDVRGGSGNRSSSRVCLKWLAQNDAAWLTVNIDLIPKYGRWDDLESLYGTTVEPDALRIWSKAILAKDGLACKWASRNDNHMRGWLKMTPKDYRKFLVANTKVVEQQMCANEWECINYEHVPSKAMNMYAKAFGVHDTSRFNAFKEAVKKGDAKINSSVVFPHDCVKAVIEGDSDIGELQFANMPDFVKDKNMRVIAVCDFSGSMMFPISSKSKVTPYNVALGLSAYFSSRVAKNNPFYKKFLAFSNDSAFIDWSKCGFTYLVKHIDGGLGHWSQSTNIERALHRMVDHATTNNLGKEDVPNTLLIISDMQFNCCIDGLNSINSALQKFAEAGYDLPKIVFWNVKGNAGSYATKDDTNMALISGFSPSILDAVFGGEVLTPLQVMLKAIQKYVKEIKVPAFKFVADISKSNANRREYKNNGGNKPWAPVKKPAKAKQLMVDQFTGRMA